METIVGVHVEYGVSNGADKKDKHSQMPTAVPLELSNGQARRWLVGRNDLMASSFQKKISIFVQ